MSGHPQFGIKVYTDIIGVSPTPLNLTVLSVILELNGVGVW